MAGGLLLIRQLLVLDLIPKVLETVGISEPDEIYSGNLKPCDTI